MFGPGKYNLSEMCNLTFNLLSDSTSGNTSVLEVTMGGQLIVYGSVTIQGLEISASNYAMYPIVVESGANLQVVSSNLNGDNGATDPFTQFYMALVLVSPGATATQQRERQGGDWRIAP